ncbi:MAG: hypothetical protein Phyf2KO_10550 [Phycisphaerales bacterium]
MRLVDQAAVRCAERGLLRIALFGGGTHTRKFIRQPWHWRGITVTCVLDDLIEQTHIDGVPIICPDKLLSSDVHVDAVVISSELQEQTLYERACSLFEQAVPVLRIYGDPIPVHEPGPEGRDRVIDRLIDAGRSSSDAKWLADNRTERHDASVGTLPPARTEIHIRRYILAARFVQNANVLDIACGTGYGSALLSDLGAKRVTGLDIEQACVDYANTYHQRSNTSYAVADAAATGLESESCDLITSFETIEHTTDPAAVIKEFARVLRPGGVLVISTPNDLGLTDFHEHSLTPDQFTEIVASRFDITHNLGQIPGNDPVEDDLPPGIFKVQDASPKPETLLAIAIKR